MKITSSSFENNASIPTLYTCEGKSINPPLSFSEIPASAQSLVLIIDDPDAPSGTWVHWTLWNIDPKTTGIAENSVPSNAVQGVTSSGKKSYGAPCPPSGTHHYHFKLYALDAKLDLPDSSDVKKLEAAMKNHIIDSSDLIGLYSKNKS